MWWKLGDCFIARPWTGRPETVSLAGSWGSAEQSTARHALGAVNTTSMDVILFFFFIINSHTAMTVSFIHTFFMQPCSAAILRFSAHHTVFLFPFQLRVARHRTGPGERLDITSLANFVPSALRSRAVLHTFRSLSFSLCSWMFVIWTEVITM